MGIKGLTKLIGDICPEAIKENEVKNYFGRKIAIDTSMALYAFLIAVRPEMSVWLTNEAGETTSHILGIWSRSLRLIKHGVKPIFVFDGKAPSLKSGELVKRSQKKKEAQEGLDKAKEEGDKEAIVKLEKRTVHVTSKHNDECKKLLRLMGLPVIEAPSEAEAQCAVLVKAGIAFATGSEDMDSLTFGTPILLRRLNLAESQQKPIMEIYLDKVLAGLGLTKEQFIDMCILCGCDYTSTIRGIGPKRALEFIQKWGCIEEVLKNLDSKKFGIPEDFNYRGARELFNAPEVTPADQIDLKWEDPNEEELMKYLVEEKAFSVERVKKGIQILKRARGSAVQGRLDGFFSVSKKPASPKPKPAAKKGAKGSPLVKTKSVPSIAKPTPSSEAPAAAPVPAPVVVPAKPRKIAPIFNMGGKRKRDAENEEKEEAKEIKEEKEEMEDEVEDIEEAEDDAKEVKKEEKEETGRSRRRKLRKIVTEEDEEEKEEKKDPDDILA